MLASLPPDLVDFLVETSVLESFDAELCAAVTGIEDAALVLDRLLAANLFLVPLDEPAQLVPLPPPVRRVPAGPPGVTRPLAAAARPRTRHRRALQDRGFVAGALRHAMAIGDADRIGAILRATVGHSMSISEGADDAVRAVRLWLHELGPSAIESDPMFVLELLIGLMGLTRPDDAPAWLDRIRAAHPDADGPLTALIEGAWNEHHQNHGQPLEALRRMQLAVDAVGGRPPNVGLLPLLHVSTARAHIQAGQFDEAAAVLEDGHAHPVGSPVADVARNRGVAAFVAATRRRAAPGGAARPRRPRSPPTGSGWAATRSAGSTPAWRRIEVHLERHEHEDARDAPRRRAGRARMPASG